MGEVGTSVNVPSWPATLDTNNTVEINTVPGVSIGSMIKAETINDVSAVVLKLESWLTTNIVQSLSGSTISPNLNSGNVIYVALSQNLTAISNPIGTEHNYDGATLTYVFAQDATGGRTVSGWGSKYKHLWSDSGNTASKISSIRFRYIQSIDTWVQEGSQSSYM